MPSPLSPPAYPENLIGASDHAAVAGVSYLGAHMDVPPVVAASFAATETAGCSMGNRFDRSASIAYDFDDRSRLSLNMKIHAGFDGGMEMNRAMLTYRYRFQPIKRPAERCQYQSHWQGLVGSGYNELFVRDHNTVWSEIRDRGLDFWNR